MSKWLFAKYRSPESELPIGVIVDDQQDLVIAEVYLLDDGVNHGPLMACAPEMRDELQWLIECMDGVVDGSYEPDEDTTEQAKKVLARAEATHAKG